MIARLGGIIACVFRDGIGVLEINGLSAATTVGIISHGVGTRLAVNYLIHVPCVLNGFGVGIITRLSSDCDMVEPLTEYSLLQVLNDQTKSRRGDRVQRKRCVCVCVVNRSALLSIW